MAFHLARNAQYNNRPAALALVVRKSLNNQGLKPFLLCSLSARLKSCPDTRHFFTLHCARVGCQRLGRVDTPAHRLPAGQS